MYIVVGIVTIPHLVGCLYSARTLVLCSSRMLVQLGGRVLVSACIVRGRLYCSKIQLLVGCLYGSRVLVQCEDACIVARCLHSSRMLG